MNLKLIIKYFYPESPADSSSESNTESQESAASSSNYTSSSSDSEDEVKQERRSGADGKSQPTEGNSLVLDSLGY